MLIDTLSIILIAVVVVVAVVSFFANPLFRRIRDAEVAEKADDDMPKLTVLVLAGNNAEALDAHLPIILTQDYKPGYEVVVVGEQGDQPVETVLKQYGCTTNLYATYIPQRSLFMSKSKLAVALGVKAAHNEWIVLVDAACRPTSDQWLTSLARHMDSEANLVMGYINYDDETKPCRRFDRMRTACYLLHKASAGTAYRSNGANIAFRRSEFIENDGYRGNLHLATGEYDFIVNKYARQYSTRVAIEPEAVVREDVPSSKAWHNTNVFYIHNRQFMQRTASFRALCAFDTILMYANYLLAALAVTFASITERWVLLGVAIVVIVATIVGRSMMARSKCRQLGETLSTWSTVFHELAIVWHRITDNIRYARSDKYDFTTHKL